MNGLSRTLFFGNYFYGFCTVALSVEASLQQHTPLNSLLYYLIVFTGTVLYYTHAYIAEPGTNQPNTTNQRSLWYFRHHKWVTRSQIILTTVMVLAILGWLVSYRQNLVHINMLHLALWLLFPIVAAFYYGSAQPARTTHNLRNNGWLKPFIIGFVWAGAVTVYPVLFSSIERDAQYVRDYLNILLFIKNLMFISMLCIMFDIKDYAADHNRLLKTFVVRIGLRKTIYYILIPLSFIGLGTFMVYAVLHDFPLLRIVINTVPFILLIIVAHSMHRRKSILYYLAIIDGLMLAKAICGIIGMTLIN